MKPSPDEIKRGLAAYFDLKENGPGEGKFPVSVTKNPQLYVERIGEAMLTEEPSLRERLQRQCSDWGTYWRAPDAHGVVLSIWQALALLRDALGVEVEIHQTGIETDGGEWLEVTRMVDEKPRLRWMGESHG